MKISTRDDLDEEGKKIYDRIYKSLLVKSEEVTIKEVKKELKKIKEKKELE
jgi:lysozyme family protein